MKNILKKITFILTITLCAQAPLQALWCWGNSQQTQPATNSTSSWTAWFLGGAAVATLCTVGYKYLYPQWKKHQHQTKVNKEFSDTLENPNLSLPVKLQKIIDILPQGPTNLNYQKKSTGDTALHVAIVAGHQLHFNNVEVVQKLTAAKADTNIQNHDGDTPLHYIARYAGTQEWVNPNGERFVHTGPDIVQTLVEAEANVNSTNKQNETPFDVAIQTFDKHQKWMKYRKNHNSDMIKKEWDIQCVAQKLIHSHADITSVDQEKNTLLHRAATQGWDSETVTLLLGQQAINVGAVNIHSQTALDLANEIAKSVRGNKEQLERAQGVVDALNAAK
jgi:ankyrin repeat protein